MLPKGILNTCINAIYILKLVKSSDQTTGCVTILHIKIKIFIYIIHLHTTMIYLEFFNNIFIILIQLHLRF